MGVAIKQSSRVHNHMGGIFDNDDTEEPLICLVSFAMESFVSRLKTYSKQYVVDQLRTGGAPLSCMSPPLVASHT